MEILEIVVAWLAAVAFLVGSGFCLVASIGVARLPDPLTRMHAATKAGTLGVGLVLLGASIAFAEAETTLKAIAIFGFILITAPVAAHVIGTIVWRHGAEGDRPGR